MASSRIRRAPEFAAVRIVAREKGLQAHLPSVAYCGDNAAMIAITGYYKFLQNELSGQDVTPFPKGQFS